jgi:hypothetical protein
VGSPALIERDRELAALDALLEVAAHGRGRLLVVAGEAGIGKSALLAAARGRASSLRVLAASGGALETGFAFGVARQLLGAAVTAERLTGAATAAAPALGLSAVGDRALDAGQRALSFELQHGLYWLTADLAEQAPLLMAVDDVQWADPDSLGFLLYLARRLEDLRVALLVAVREGEPCAAPETLAALRAERSATSGSPARATRRAAATPSCLAHCSTSWAKGASPRACSPPAPWPCSAACRCGWRGSARPRSRSPRRWRSWSAMRSSSRPPPSPGSTRRRRARRRTR